MMRLAGMAGILTLVLGCTPQSSERSGVQPAPTTPVVFNAAGAPTSTPQFPVRRRAASGAPSRVGLGRRSRASRVGVLDPLGDLFVALGAADQLADALCRPLAVAVGEIAR